MTVVIQIGNSDNKLSQNEWAHFAAGAKLAIGSNVFRIHFQGGSDWDAPWQNACFVCELGSNSLDKLKKELAMLCLQFNQESIAITCGQTHFITAEVRDA